MTINELLDTINDEMRTLLLQLPIVSATSLALDGRCGMVWIDLNNDLIITENRSSLDYYGGFEYITKEAITTIGKYTIYDAKYEDDARISTAIDHYRHLDESVYST